MRTIAAILLALSIVTLQWMHGGAFVPALSIPGYWVLVASAVFALGVAIRSQSVPAWRSLLLAMVVAGFLLWRDVVSSSAYLARVDGTVICASMVAFLVAASLPDGKSRRTFLIVLMLGVVAQGVVGAGKLTGATDGPALHWFSKVLEANYTGRFEARLTGTFLNPNQLAWFVGAMGIMSLSLCVWGRSHWGARLFFGYMAVICVTMDVLTVSRGGLASLGVGLLVFLGGSLIAVLTARRGNQARMLLMSGVAVVLAMAAACVIYFSSWTAQGRVEALGLPDLRNQLTVESFRAFQMAPVLGAGPGAYLFLGRLLREGNQPFDPFQAHDDWLQVLVEYGIVGFAAVVLLTAVLLMGGFRRFVFALERMPSDETRLSNNTAAILIGAVSACCVFAVHSLTDFNFRIPANAIFAAALAGLLTNPDFRRSSRKARPWTAKGVQLAGLLGFGTVLALALARYQRPDRLHLQAENALMERNAASAVTLSREAANLDPANWKNLLILARAMKREAQEPSRDSSGRIRDFVVDDDPSRVQARVARLMPVAEIYAKALELEPRERAAAAEYAGVLRITQGWQPAVGKWRQAIARDPNHAYAYIAYGYGLLDEGRENEALKLYYIASQVPAGQAGAELYSNLLEEISRRSEGSAQ